MYLGAHLGIADGLPNAVAEARRLSLESLQIFSKSPQMWAGPPLPVAAAKAFRSAVASDALRATAVHHGYLLNLGSPKPPMLKRSKAAFLDEIGRAELLGVDALIFHPGAHLGAGVPDGLRTIAQSLGEALEATPSSRPRLLLENAAGQGTTLCSTFEELQEVLDAVDAKERVGVALDTCHLFAAGYEFTSEEGYGRMVDAIGATIGRDRVLAFHLNDAKAPLGSHLDRHENIGRGQIGEEGFRRLVNDRHWAKVPGYLETPLDDRGYARYAEDIATLRSLLASRGAPASGEKRLPSTAPAAATPARARKPTRRRAR